MANEELIDLCYSYIYTCLQVLSWTVFAQYQAGLIELCLLEVSETIFWASKERPKNRRTFMLRVFDRKPGLFVVTFSCVWEHDFYIGVRFIHGKSSKSGMLGDSHLVFVRVRCAAGPTAFEPFGGLGEKKERKNKKTPSSAPTEKAVLMLEDEAPLDFWEFWATSEQMQTFPFSSLFLSHPVLFCCCFHICLLCW